MKTQPKRIFITGGTGFAGSHLIDLYLKQYPDYKLFSIKRRRSDVDNIKHLKDGQVKWFDCDITDAYSVEKTIREIQPDVIHHLAAQSFVPASWDYPVRTIEVNIVGSLNILEAVKNFAPECIIQVASSSEIYGIPRYIPINEDTPTDPISPYAVSKLAMDRLAFQYHKSFDLKTVITRSFNYTGERRGSEFVCSSFAKQIAEIELKIKKPVIMTGNLSAKRDFTDVKDMVKAFLISTERCNYGTPYVVASKKMVTIQWVLDTLLGFTQKKITVQQDDSRMRPSDLHVLKGNPEKFMLRTEWKPEYKLEQTLSDLLEYWRKKLAHGQLQHN